MTHSIAPTNNVGRILCMFLDTTITRSLPSYQPNFILLYHSCAFPGFWLMNPNMLFAYQLPYHMDRGPFFYIFVVLHSSVYIATDMNNITPSNELQKKDKKCYIIFHLSFSDLQAGNPNKTALKIEISTPCQLNFVQLLMLPQ